MACVGDAVIRGEVLIEDEQSRSLSTGPELDVEDEDGDATPEQYSGKNSFSSTSVQLFVSKVTEGRTEDLKPNMCSSSLQKRMN